MDKKDKIIAVLIGVIVFAVGIGLGWLGEYHFAVQIPYNRQQAAVKQQQKQLQKESRSGSVVSFNADTITVAVKSGGNPAEIGKTVTYNVSQYTNVQKDYSLVSKYGHKPDLNTIGLKNGYYVNMLVNNGNVIDIQFFSNGKSTPPVTSGSPGPVSPGPAIP